MNFEVVTDFDSPKSRSGKYIRSEENASTDQSEDDVSRNNSKTNQSPDAVPISPIDSQNPPTGRTARQRRASLLASVSSNVMSWANLERTTSKDVALDFLAKKGWWSTLKSGYLTTVRGLARCCECIPVILPSNRFVEKWDLIMIFLLIYVATVSPYDMAFLPTRIDTIFFFNRLVDVCFLVDMFLQFNMAFYGAYGRLNKDRGDIMVNYIHSWFIIDLISIMPFDTISFRAEDSSLSNMQGLKAMRLLRLAKMLRLLRANRMFQRFEARWEINYSVMQLYGYLCMLFLLIHWLACGWYMVITLEGAVECLNVPVSGQECCTNWLDCYSFADSQEGRTAGRKYFVAIVWSTAEVLTVSSDVFAVTDVERGYVVTVRVMSGVIYAYLIGAVCSIFTTLTKDQMKFFEDMDVLNHFVSSMHVTRTDPELCASLRMFYRYRHNFSTGSSQIKEIFEVISPNLRGELAFQVHSHWLKNLWVFKDCALSKPFYVSIALRLEQRISAPMENVIEPHDRADTMFVIERGMVLSKGKVKTVGDCFGEDCMWSTSSNMKRGYQATAMTHGKLILLDSDSLFEILQRPQFRVESKNIRKRISFQKMRQLIVLFYKLLLEATEAATLRLASEQVYESLSFVDEDQLDLIFAIFIRFYLRHSRWGESAPENIKDFLNEIRSPERQLLYDMQRKLEPFGLKAMAQDFIEKERMDLEDLMRITSEELSLLGVPLGVAIDFCQHRDSKSAASTPRISSHAPQSSDGSESSLGSNRPSVEEGSSPMIKFTNPTGAAFDRIDSRGSQGSQDMWCSALSAADI